MVSCVKGKDAGDGLWLCYVGRNTRDTRVVLSHGSEEREMNKETESDLIKEMGTVKSRWVS